MTDTRPSGTVRSLSDQRGFSLIEGVIALFVLGVLGGATLSLLRNQDRFYSHLDNSVLAEQNLRAAADLVSAEVRQSMSEDLIAARPESVSVRFDVHQAVVCEVVNPDQLQIFVYDTVPRPNLAGGFVGTGWSGPYQITYEYADGWTPGGGPQAAAKTTCEANQAPSGFPASRYRTTSGWNSAGFSQTPPRGSIIKRYRQLTYRFAPSAMGNGYALWRGTQELIGPLDPTSAFAYLMSGGGVQNSVSPANFGNVRAVRINAVAIDDDPRYDLQRLLQFDMPLRQ